MEDCNQQCGIVTHGSVNVPKTNVIESKDPLSKAIEDNVTLEPDSEKIKAVFEDCYQNICLKGIGGLPLEECIINCGKFSKLKAGKQDAETGNFVKEYKDEEEAEEAEYYKVDADCVRICRKEKDATADSCNEACKKFEE